MANIDKLVFVSKLLLDQRLIELKQENESLKLELFWRDYKFHKLQHQMKNWNLYGGPKCKCNACCGQDLAGDYELEDIQERICGFKPAFESFAAVHGLTFGKASHPIDECLDECHTHISGDNCLFVYDIDAHIIQIDNGSRWTYGTKLWKAKSVSDPELKKLVVLFKAIDTQVRIDLGLF